MKKMALILTIGLIFWLMSPAVILADFDGMIKETRNLLSMFGIQNKKLVEMLDFISRINGQGPETYVECVACKILMEEEKLLISQSQNLLFEIEKIIKQAKDAKKEGAFNAEEKEKIKKEIQSKMNEISQKIDKISAIHLKVMEYLSGKFNFLLKESEKVKRTPVQRPNKDIQSRIGS
jgi:hypothetical protein